MSQQPATDEPGRTPLPDGEAAVGVAIALALLYAVLAIPAVAGHELLPSYAGASAGLAASLVALSTIDVFRFRLPDALTLPLAAIGLALTWWLAWDTLANRATAAVLGYAILALVAFAYRRLRHRHGLGLGDAKLFGAAGAWLGYEGLPFVLLYASAIALCAVVAAMAAGRAISATSKVPFGPFLALGIWIVWLYGTGPFIV